MTETEKLTKRISELEKELSSKFEGKTRLEEALANNYAAGEEPGKNLKALTECRDSIEAIRGALNHLDLKLYEKQKLEHVSLAEKLDDEINKRFEKALQIALKGLKSVEQSLRQTISTDNLPDLSMKMLEVVKAEIWKVLDAEASDRYAVEVPAMPAAVRPRDEFGVPYDSPLAM